MLEIAGADDNLVTHLYKTDGYEVTIDDRIFNSFEVISGSDNLSNQIYAGENGSSIRGGSNSDDELYGNVGYDEFIYCYGDDHDSILNAGNENAINLNGVTLEQILSAEITDSGVNLKFVDDRSLNING